MTRNRKDLDTAKWKQIRKLVLARDHHTCHYCQAHANSVDHIIAPSIAPERAFDLDNLVAACTPCNSARGSAQRAAKSIFFEPSSTPSTTAFLSLPKRIEPDSSPFK